MGIIKVADTFMYLKNAESAIKKTGRRFCVLIRRQYICSVIKKQSEEESTTRETILKQDLTLWAFKPVNLGFF